MKLKRLAFTTLMAMTIMGTLTSVYAEPEVAETTSIEATAEESEAEEETEATAEESEAEEETEATAEESETETETEESETGEEATTEGTETTTDTETTGDEIVLSEAELEALLNNVEQPLTTFGWAAGILGLCAMAVTILGVTRI